MRLSILAVIAHPDDETNFAGTLYLLSHYLDAQIDLIVVTDGAGGYKHSQQAEKIHELKLTDPDIAKKHMPRIRKQEMLKAAEIVGIKNVNFLKIRDDGYTKDYRLLLSEENQEIILSSLNSTLKRGSYDFIFTLLPTANTHGHHKSVAYMVLMAANKFSGTNSTNPVVLGVPEFIATDDVECIKELEKPDSHGAIDRRCGSFSINKSEKLLKSSKGVLTLNDVVDSVIGCHVSQGTLPKYKHSTTHEDFYVYRENPQYALSKTKKLFEKLSGVISRLKSSLSPVDPPSEDEQGSDSPYRMIL